MSINPLNDISRVYLEQVSESSHLETDMNTRHEKNEKAIEDMKKTKGYKDMASAAKKKMEEEKKPNDGNLANNYPPYDKVTRGDVIAGRLGKDQMGGKKKVATKESFSNWRQDLAEVMTDTEDNKKIKEKKIQNKVTINPKLGESVEQLGGTLLEMVEIDEFDYILESAYDELLEEGYDDDAIEDALEYALTEAKVTFGHDTPTAQKKKEGLLSAARKRLAGAKAAAKQAVATGARKVAKGALGVARKMEAGDKKPAATAARKPSTYRGAGAGQKERVSSGSYTPPAKKKAEKPADPWEGSATTPSKPKAKKAAAPKAKAPAATTAKKKRKSKLDALLADVRNEETQIDEKITAKTDMGTAIKDFYASKSPQLAGRTKEERRKAAIAAVLTARRGGRKLGEQMTGMTGSGQPVSSQKPEIDKKQEMINKQKYANLKMLQQKKQQLERQKLQMQKSGKLPLEAD
jgi:hypothetical protein